MPATVHTQVISARETRLEFIRHRHLVLASNSSFGGTAKRKENRLHIQKGIMARMAKHRVI